MKKTILTFLLLALFPIIASAQIYYVDASLGNDTRDGKSPVNAWQTLTKVNAATFLVSGDSVLFKCGETWRETLVIPSSGAAGNPITFSKYGNCTGSNNPKFKGSKVVNGWNPSSGSIYSANTTLIRQPRSYLVNGSFDFDVSNWYSQYGTDSVTWSSDCGLAGGCLKFTAHDNNSAVTPTNVDRYYWSDPTYTLSPGTYQLEFKLRASDNQGSFQVYVDGRKSGVLLIQSNIPSSPDWQSYTSEPITLSAADTLFINFRYYRPDYPTTYYLDDVRLVPTTTQYDGARQVFVDGTYVNPTQFPKPFSADPTDTYIPYAEDSIAVTGSTTPPSCPDSRRFYGMESFVCFFEVNANDLTGTGDLTNAGVHLRIAAYLIEDRTIVCDSAYPQSSQESCPTATPGNRRFMINMATRYNISKGWGLYFDNAPWMLDIPNSYLKGEWYYVNNTQQLSIRLPDTQPPANRVEAGHRDYGIIASSRAYLVFDGINIEQYQTGLDLSYSSNVIVRNNTVRDSGVVGIVASNATSATIQNCTIENAVQNGILSANGSDISVINNTIRNIGTVGSPKDTGSAVDLQKTSISVVNGISNNHVSNVAAFGITGGRGVSSQLPGVISNNVVDNTCTILEDCGALYTSLYSAGEAGSHNPVYSLYSRNIVRNVTGNPHGKPPTSQPDTHGIYLDQQSSYVRVENNTMTGVAGAGMSIGQSDNNTVTGNTIYKTGQTSISILKGFNTYDSSYNNRFDGNILFTDQAKNVIRGRFDYPFVVDLTGGVALQELGYYMQDFLDNDNTIPYGPCWNCTFNNHRYNGLYQPLIVGERIGSNIPANSAVWNYFTLPQWQTQRLQDLNATLFNPFSIARYRMTGIVDPANLVTSGTYGTFDNNNTSGWGQSNGAFFSPIDCVTGGCLGYLYTQTDSSILSGGVGSNSITITKGQYYLIHFDLRAVKDQQRVDVSVAGTKPDGNYGAIGLVLEVTANKTWQSYSYVFVADNPSNAAIVFNLYTPGDGIELDNVRLQPITAPAVAFNDPSSDSAILINDTSQAKAIACPDATKCNAYVYFNSGKQVKWPVTVPAMSSQIVVWSASPFKDTDRDGIVDSKDSCPNTVVNSPVDERGCSFIQQHPLDLLPTALNASLSGTNNVILADTVKNQGSANAGSFTIRYYISTNNTYESGTDIPLASSSNGTGICNRTLTSFNAGASSSVSNKTCYKPSAALAGINYYVLVVDDALKQIIEYNEGNNVRATGGTIRW